MKGWKKNLYIIWAAELVAILGFMIAFPLFPFFVQELGVTDLKQVEIWSGLLSTSTALAMALFSPLWGSVADRYGRKLMLERAMFAGAVIIFAMGFVTNVQQLLFLRILQGSLTGTVPASIALVAAMSPQDEIRYSLGLMQIAVFSGAFAGPILGGIVADLSGSRVAFRIAGAMLLLAGLAILAFAEERFEPGHSKVESPMGSLLHGLRVAIASSQLLTAIVVVFLVQLARVIVSPLLPLFVQSLNPAGERVASTAGGILGVDFLCSAIAATTIARISNNIGYRRALACCILGNVPLYALQALVRDSTQLLILRAASGGFMGGIMPMVNAIIATSAPEGRQSSTIGLSHSATSLGNAIGPILGAIVAAALGMRSTFLCSAAIFTLAGIWVARAIRAPR